MGNIRTPKTIYKNGFVVDFYVEKKVVYYIIYKWTEKGYVRSDLESGKLGDRTRQQMMDYTLQSFTNVGVIEN